MSDIVLEEQGTPTGLGPDEHAVYPKADGRLYARKGTDAERPIEGINPADFVNVASPQTVTGEKSFAARIISLITGTAANLLLNNSTASSFWEILVGRSAFFDNWLLFKNENEAGSITAALTDSGSWRSKDGSAGSPAYGFINASNYGMLYDSGSNQLRLSTSGIARLGVAANGLLTVLTSDYENLISNDDDIVNRKWIVDKIGPILPDPATLPANQFLYLKSNATQDGYEYFQEYEAVVSDRDVIGTQLDSFQQRKRLTVNIPVVGEYTIAWAFTWSYNSTGDNFEAQIEVDDTDQIFLMQQEPQDSGGSGITMQLIEGGTANTGTDQRMPASGFTVYNFTATGNHTIDFDIACQVANNEAAVYAMSLSCKRNKS